MLGTQNETDGIRIADCGFRNVRSTVPSHSAFRNPQSAFTLTELLVVITIIAILAGLITGAALNALKKAKQAAITLELQQIGAALEDFKSELGAYPPNGMIRMTAPINTFAANDFVRMFKKAFPRHKEHPELILALAGGPVVPGLVTVSDLEDVGMTGAEAVYFWLGGFSSDVAYPISGPGGPSFADGPDSGTSLDLTDEVVEDRNLRYEFKLDQLLPRTADNLFDPSVGRFITYNDPRPGAGGAPRRINFWFYAPSGSTLPIAYFDTSRHTPQQYDLDMYGTGGVYAIKQFREGVTEATATSNADVRFVEDKKFQILHCGTDDIWGDQFLNFHLDNTNASAYSIVTLAPEGPFIGDVADTLGHFMAGTLEDKQE